MRKLLCSSFIAILLSSMALAIPVIAEDLPLTTWQPKIAIFQGYGWFTSYTGPFQEPGRPSTGDICTFLVSGSKIRNTWSGVGTWYDRDWHEGPLRATFTINGGSLQHDPNTGHVTEIFTLSGSAKVYVGGLYKGTYEVQLTLADSAKVNLVEGQGPPDPMWNIDWLDFALKDYYVAAGRLGGVWPGGGNINTWWYPTFPGM